MKKIYLIKDIARLSDLSVHTVKYYLNFGLIGEQGRSPETNYRYFDDSTLEKLTRIKDYRRRNLSLNKIKELVNTGA